MPVSERFKRAARRSLERVGTTATVTNYTEGATDEHGDPSRVQENQETGVPALFRRDARLKDAPEVPIAGMDSAVDVLVWLPDSQDVREPGGADGGGGHHVFPTRITNENTGKRYDVLTEWEEDNGQIRAGCKEV